MPQFLEQQYAKINFIRLFQIASIDDMCEWLVPATFNFLQSGKDMILSIPFSEPHLFSSMLRIMRAVLGIDESMARERQQKQQGSGGDKTTGAGEKGAAATTTTTGATADSSGAAQQIDIIHLQVIELGNSIDLSS